MRIMNLNEANQSKKKRSKSEKKYLDKVGTVGSYRDRKMLLMSVNL